MRVLADLHLHSRFSVATSGRMELAEIARAAARKGIDLVGTGDCTHAEWLASARRVLRAAGDGVYALGKTLFLITGEVSVVWREAGRGRRVHLLLVVPSISAGRAVAAALGRWGALDSDGRPVLSCSAQSAVDAVWSVAPDALVVPAHIWTPWYSILGSRSGFATILECLGPYAERIAAVETGLSSDPAMCRRLSALDRVTLLSFSDAHSPDRLGREATVLELEEVSYPAISAALRTPASRVKTVELFPQEGKYYYDGHRACGISVSPPEAESLAGLCPACGKPLTPGVLHRVEDLADRESPRFVPPFVSTIPLNEIVAHVIGRGAQSSAAACVVEELVALFGSEISILLDCPIEDLRDRAPAGVAEAIEAVREGRVIARPGYDGVYGVVRPDV